MFKNINKTFLIKSNIDQKKLSKCILFIIKQSNLKKIEIKKRFNQSVEKFIKIPKNINIETIDIIIKTKINEDYKFVSLEKSLIFYSQKNRLKLSSKKLLKYELKNIYFFPPTFFFRGIVKQNLSRGTNYIPKKISEFDNSRLTNISKVIRLLSSKKKLKLKVDKYLNNFKFLSAKNLSNQKIINSLILILKNYKNKQIMTTLTHGDFKCEHLFSLNNKLEYVIDWENIGRRSIFFDLFNYFIPWFAQRSQNYFKIKIFILKFVKKYLPHLLNCISGNYDLYFSIFALERYSRVYSRGSLQFDIKQKAYKRFNNIFKKLINDLKNEY